MFKNIQSQLSKYFVSKQVITSFVSNPQVSIIIKTGNELLYSHNLDHQIKIINYVDNSCQSNFKNMIIAKVFNQNLKSGKYQIKILNNDFKVKFIKDDNIPVIELSNGICVQKFLPKNKKQYYLPCPDIYLLLSDGKK